MGHPILKGCVKEVRSYAKTIGVELTQAQTYEIVARARGFYNANVLAAEYVPTGPDLNAVTPPVASSKPRKKLQNEVSDVEVVESQYKKVELQEKERMDLGVVGLRSKYVYDCTDRARMMNRPVEMEVILPLPFIVPPTRKAISELMFSHSDVVTDCRVELVDYPYGKYYRGYLVKFKPYSFALPTESLNPRMGFAKTPEGLRECLYNPAYLSSLRIGFGFSEIDWKVGFANVIEEPIDGFFDEAKYLRFAPTQADNDKKMWLSKKDVHNLRHLVGCYYEVTTGLYEGMRIAFYV